MKPRCVTDPAYEDVNNCHERAFVFMHKVGGGGGSWARGVGRWGPESVDVDEAGEVGVLLPLCT